MAGNGPDNLLRAIYILGASPTRLQTPEILEARRKAYELDLCARVACISLPTGVRRPSAELIWGLGEQVLAAACEACGLREANPVRRLRRHLRPAARPQGQWRRGRGVPTRAVRSLCPTFSSVLVRSQFPKKLGLAAGGREFAKAEPAVQRLIDPTWAPPRL